MKILVKENGKRVLSIMLSLMMAFSLCTPAFAVQETATLMGTVEGITSGLTVSGSEEITVTNEDEITIYYSKANPSIGRNSDGWWAGIKVIAPAGLTEEELKAVKYRRYDAGGEAERVFWSVKDSADDADVHYIEMWITATPEIIAADDDGKLTTTYVFDWYGNGFDGEVQTINFALDAEKLNLDHENHYGSVQSFTEGLAVDGTEALTVTNKETVNLTFSRMNPSVGRYYDGWWAGIRVFAPEGLTAEQLKNAKYRKWNGTGWNEPADFWNIKDSQNDATVHYFDSWMCVTPEIIAKDADKKLSVIYEFDWDGNGFGISTQRIEFVLDVENINLNMDPFLGDVEGITSGLTVSGSEEITVTNEDEITLYYSKADPSIGRNSDGWWAGIKVIAPAGLTEEELKAVKYRRYDAGGEAERVFWNVKDSADDADVHYIEMWITATPEIIAADDDGKLTTTYVFDWYGNGFDGEVQTINFVLDAEKLNLDHENHYGSVDGITENLTVEGETDIVIKNDDVITIDFALADESIGRYMDAWWVGAKIYAPEDMSVEELKEATYNNGSGVKSFWEFRDSADDADRHYIEIWVPVIQDWIDNDADGILNWTYEFDWDNNGYGISTQKVRVSIDVNKINRIHSAGCTKIVEEEAVAPDCENAGQNEKSYCEVCGLVLGDGADLPALGHDEIPHEAQAVTCTEIGWDAYVTCSRCDYTTYEEIPALGHDEIPHEAQEENCTEIGWDAYVTCSRCDYTTYEEIPALGHDEIPHEAQAVTCTEIGWDAYETCSRCDYTTYEEIPALGHDEIPHEAQAVTCTVIGWDAYVTCSRCDYTTYEEIPALGHDEIPHEAQEETCTEIGWDAYVTCSRCDYTTYEEIPALGHDKIPHEAQAVTCTEIGWDAYETCSRCDYTTYEEIPVLGHDKIPHEAQAVTCTEIGWDAYVTCSRCDYTTYEEISALGHDEIPHKAQAVTCTEIGWEAYVTCSRCDYTTYEEIPALGHDKTSHDAKAPECVRVGWYAYEDCSRCDYTTYKEIAALGHDYSEMIIDSKHLSAAKTCTTYAKYFYDCSRCEDMTVKTFENKAEGFEPHDKTKKLDSIHLISAADCENAAKYYMGCKNCDTVFKSKADIFEDGYPKYHLFTEEKVTTKASLNKQGYTNFFCEDCGKMDADAIAFAGIKTVTISGTSFSYTGKAITPAVTVKDSAGVTLKNGTDYTVKYSSNTAPGTATVTVTFTGRYTGSTTLKFTIGELAATKKISFSSTTTTVKLTWDKVAFATGYKVYRKTSKGWTEVGSTTDTSLTVKKLSKGTKYTFMVKAYAKVDGKTYVASASKSINTATKAAAVSKLTATQTVTTITLKWSKSTGADSYKVYKYNSKTKKYSYYKTVKATKLTIKKLKSGTSYKYLVKPVTLTDDKQEVIGEEKKLTASTKPAATTISVSSKKGTATVKWKKVNGATGYQIYTKNAKTGKLERIGTVKAGKTSFVKKGYKLKSKQMFAVRAYRTVNGKNIYGEFTKKIVTIK